MASGAAVTQSLLNASRLYPPEMPSASGGPGQAAIVSGSMAAPTSFSSMTGSAAQLSSSGAIGSVQQQLGVVDAGPREASASSSEPGGALVSSAGPGGASTSGHSPMPEPFNSAMPHAFNFDRRVYNFERREPEPDVWRLSPEERAQPYPALRDDRPRRPRTPPNNPCAGM